MLKILRTHEAKGLARLSSQCPVAYHSQASFLFIMLQYLQRYLYRPVLEEDRPMWFCKSLILDRPLSLAFLQLMGRA